MCVCVYVCESERVSESVCVSESVRVSESVCMSESVRVSERERECVCVC